MKNLFEYEEFIKSLDEDDKTVGHGSDHPVRKEQEKIEDFNKKYYWLIRDLSFGDIKDSTHAVIVSDGKTDFITIYRDGIADAKEAKKQLSKDFKKYKIDIVSL